MMKYAKVVKEKNVISRLCRFIIPLRIQTIVYILLTLFHIP